MDFTLTTASSQKEYLDLMEVIPRTWVGGPHNRAPVSYINGEFADAIYKEILKKSQDYESIQLPIHLLIYPTDWRLDIGLNVQQCLSYMCCSGHHKFKTIICYSPDDRESGEVIQIYPQPLEAFNGFNEVEARNSITTLGDVTRVLVEEGGAVVVPLTPPPIRKSGGI